MRTPKLQLAAEQPLTGDCWIPPGKIPHVQGQRRCPSKAVGEAKLLLGSNLIPTRDARWTQAKPCAHQDPEAPQRLSQACLRVFECLLRRHGFFIAVRAFSSCSEWGLLSSCDAWGSHWGVLLQNNYTKEILAL